MKRHLDNLLILAVLAFYSLIVIRHFWIYPVPSDQLEYVQSAQWGTTVGGYWPWLDRVGLGALLGILAFLPFPTYVTAPFYGFFMSLGSLALGSYWLKARFGFGSALFFLTLIIGSFYAYHFATEIYPEPTIVFFLLLSSICLLEAKGSRAPRLLFVSGLALTIAALCKIVVIPLAGLMSLYVFKNYRFMNQWKSFALGIIGGLVFIFGFFTLAYGWSSLIDMFVSFYNWNFKFMLKGTREVNNIVSYYELFVDRGYLPTFIGLFISIGLYKNLSGRFFATIAWILGGTVCAVYIVGDRSGATIPNYMFPMFYFAAMTLAIYWGSILKSMNSLQKTTTTLLVLFALILAWGMGSKHNAEIYFMTAFHEKATFLIKALLSIGVFVLAFIPTMLELKAKKLYALLALVCIAFFSLLYNGGRAKERFVGWLHKDANFYFSQAPFFNRVPEDEFLVYYSKWNLQDRAGRAAITFIHFFNEKYEIPNGPERQKFAMDLIKEKILVVRNIQQAQESNKKIIVTDLSDEVIKTFPNSKKLGSFNWEGDQLEILQRP
ncbi:MAG: hypothetical protein KDD33_07410 [Bdellovibrionales bacterium]|nr:hypothetical protein [Bdellovibrionales bacterium]